MIINNIIKRERNKKEKEIKKNYIYIKKYKENKIKQINQLKERKKQKKSSHSSVGRAWC